MDCLLKSCEKLAKPASSIEVSKLEECGMVRLVPRDYQLQGITWLINCDSQGHGGLLCDEMGLGKTCQVICFILAVSNRKSDATFLIVSPLSVIENWRCELQSIAPNLTFMTYIGDKATRRNLRSDYNKSIKILLTTYELCINDEGFFKTLNWDYVIVDEGHRLKNSNTLLYSMLTETCLNIRFILTGTPVQNNLEELFNLLHFVAPNYFHKNLRSTFLTYFENSDKSNETDEDMAKILRPFLLRRIKQNVLTDLPPRADILIYHSLTALQTQIYRALLTRNADLFGFIINQHNNLHIHNRLHNLIMHLRKCVNHPYLFDGVEPEPFTLGEHLIQASSKLILLDLLLHFLYNPYNSDNVAKPFKPSDSKPVHKVLVFSQMTRMLDIIQDYLTLRGYSYERLDGSVRGDDRFQAVKSFNNDQETFVFLLSTRAGGQGLNLVAADTVIFVDNDFNPQIDVQAAGRAHRIGQTKPVRIIRLVCRNTIEEAILFRAENKLKLAARVLNATDFKRQQENNDDKPFTFDELNNVLKFGLAKLLNITENNGDNNNDVNNKNSTENKMDYIKPNFVQMLGETDQTTGQWLPIPPSTMNDDTLNTCGWVLLTNETFRHCEPSEADQEAVKKLQQDYELSKGKLKYEGVLNGDVVDDESLLSENATTSKSSNSNFTKLNSSRKHLSLEEIEARNKKTAETMAKLEVKRKEAQAKRIAARLEKKLSLWKSVGYKTFSVFRDESSEAELNHYPNPKSHVDQVDDDINVESIFESDDFKDETREDSESNEFSHETSAGIYYKIGDASEPLSIFSLNKSQREPDGTPPYFVCTTVDDSGHWSHGGIFRTLRIRSNNQVKDAYELAGQMDDLNLGDCLIVPVINSKYSSSSPAEKEIKTFDDYLVNCNEITKSVGNDEWISNFCGLLVAQKHSNRTYSAGEAPDLQLNSLEKSLSALGMACSRLKLCSIHIPRLGHGTQTFTWYRIERLLRKHLVDHHRISVYVYYYRPGNTNNHVSSNSPTVCVASSSSTSAPHKSVKRKASPSCSQVNHDQKLETIRPTKYLYNLFTGKSFYIDSFPCDNNIKNTNVDDNDDVKKLKRIITAYPFLFCSMKIQSVINNVKSETYML
ncbi:Chromodomain-helicase-DNA-binding protein 1-like [Schistosoma japonicum]|nr:Chromodomain-helicase-DNA-binding protein 1-like [Schistosoma japonicum]